MEALFLPLWICIVPSFVLSAPNLGCHEVKAAFAARGISQVEDFPTVPIQGHSLQTCPSDWSCCTRSMEARLDVWAEESFEDALTKRMDDMSGAWQAKANKVDEFMHELISMSQGQLHDTFTKTYGVLYKRNAMLFVEYFRELRSFYRKGNVNLQEFTSAFFATLYQKMFQVMNPQYTLDSSYLSCVTRHMRQQQPFKEVPSKVAASVKRSMVATRVLVKALRSGYKIAEEMRAIPPSHECTSALKRMRTCAACHGVPQLGPCPNLCINVVKGCLVRQIEAQERWDKFIDALLGLTDRLSGPLNVETVILPLDINISDAIMNLQDMGYQVAQKIFSACGEPRVTKREALPRAEISLRRPQESQISTPPSPPKKLPLRAAANEKSTFEKMITDLKKMIRASLGFWRQLPYQLCLIPDSDNESADTVNPNACFNGSAAAPYRHAIVEDGLTNHAYNPEMTPLSTGDPNQDATAELLMRLRSITNQVRLAQKGQDVEWWDQEHYQQGHLPSKNARAFVHDQYHGSGGEFFSDDEDYPYYYGSGYDDEMEEDMYEGSGGEGSGDSDCDDADGCDHKWPWQQPEGGRKVTESPPEEATAEDIEVLGEDDGKVVVVVVDEEGSGSSRIGGSSSILKAVIVYLLPQLVCGLPRILQLS